MISKEELTPIYQKLVKIEFNKLSNNNFNFNEPETFLTKEDIQNALNEEKNMSFDVLFNELVSNGLLVKFQENAYRTTHFDLIYRLVYIRNLEYQNPIPFEFKIILKEEFVPDFGRYEISKILPEIVKSSINNELVIKLLEVALSKSGYKGLSTYQFSLIKSILSGSYVNVAIVAPTATGKSLTFTIPVIVKSIERVLKNEGGTSCILIYPRKALERDQLQSLLRLVDVINEELQRKLGKAITVGIDDSDTPRKSGVKQGDSFRGLRCIKCGGELIIFRDEVRPIVACQKCKKEYPYIVATKDEIWRDRPTIIITNMWIVYRRLLSSRNVKLFGNLDLVVIDEAHVYTHFLGGHVSYILRMLRFVASRNGHSPIFIFSSATIPNPKEFIANLAGIDESELFYEDFNEILEKVSAKKGERLLIFLYLLPHPSRDIETLTEALLLAITLWCHKNSMKGITFIDSISEINTIMDYIHTTILGVRKGREVTDHVFQTKRFPNNDYCWVTISPNEFIDNQSKFENFVLNKYKNSIDMHYGGLSPKRRAEIENEFIKGEKRMLLSTSTLELGIDLSDVSVVLQHKLPLTPEGVVQRIGRAGRNPSCYRIALGVIVLPNLPLSTLYMFNDRLRETLENVSYLPPLRIGKLSRNLQLQHTLSLLLLKRALEGKPTYIDDEGITRTNVKDVIEEIRKELENLITFNKKVNIFEDDVLTNSINEFTKLIDPCIKGLNKVPNKAESHQPGKYEELRNIITEVESCFKQSKNIERAAENLFDIINTSKDIPQDIKSEISEFIGSIRLISSKLIELRKLLRQSIKIKSSQPIDKWLQNNLHKLNDILNKFLTKVNDVGNEIKQLSPNLDLSLFKELMSKYLDLDKHLEGKDNSFSRSFKELLEKMNQFKNLDFEEIYARKVLRGIYDELKFAFSQKLDLFKVLNLLLEDEIHFSLLLETPSPDLKLVGTEEV